MASTLSEDTIVFNALSPVITDMEVVFQALDEFYSLKQSQDSTDRFNFVVFDEEGANFLEEFTPDPEIVLERVKSLESDMITEDVNVAGGIFTAISCVIDAFREVPDKCYRLIILTDFGSLPIPVPYLLELQNLIDKIYTFPFFMELVRFNVEDFEEDKKLMSLAKRCNGEVHEINALPSLPDILEVLAIKRHIFSKSLPIKGYIEVPEQNRSFYENLGENLIYLSKEETCSICHDLGTKMVQCPNCLSLSHFHCLAGWAKQSNIGITHVFRCPHCYFLLKFKQDLLRNVSSESTLPKQIKKVGQQAFLEKHGLKLKPDVKHVQDPMRVKILSKDKVPTPSKTTSAHLNDPSVSEASEILQERKKTRVRPENEGVKVVSCINCGKIITNSYSDCPNCHFPLM